MYLSQVIDPIAPCYTALHDVVTVNIPEANEYIKLVPKHQKVMYVQYTNIRTIIQYRILI